MGYAKKRAAAGSATRQAAVAVSSASQEVERGRFLVWALAFWTGIWYNIRSKVFDSRKVQGK